MLIWSEYTAVRYVQNLSLAPVSFELMVLAYYKIKLNKHECTGAIFASLMQHSNIPDIIFHQDFCNAESTHKLFSQDCTKFDSPCVSLIAYLPFSQYSLFFLSV